MRYTMIVVSDRPGSMHRYDNCDLEDLQMHINNAALLGDKVVSITLILERLN